VILDSSQHRPVNQPDRVLPRLVPDLGTLWAETEVSAPVAGIPRLHLAGHIDNVLSIGARKRLVPLRSLTSRGARTGLAG
jgi:hypothetical protein